MQIYHQRQLNNNQINNNYHNYHQQLQSQPNIPKESNYEHPLSDEEFLARYKQKYPEEYEKLMKEAYLQEMNERKMNNINNINAIHESPYENNEGSSINLNNNEDMDEKGADVERILNNQNLTNIGPLELILCYTKLYNDFFPFFKRQIGRAHV